MPRSYNVFCVYGFPTRIHTDQGANFESAIVAKLLILAGVEKSHTTEQFNRTLGSMLRSLPLKEKHKWPEQIQTLTFAYNATVHETTGYAPFQRMFGRIPRLPVDIMFGQVLRDSVIVAHGSYVKTLMSYLHEAVSIAQKHAALEQGKQARGYNKRIKGTCLNVGDRVLITNKKERGKRKLAHKWDPNVYTVKDRNVQINIYKLIDDDGNLRVVHRNLILDISFLPVESPLEREDLRFSAEDSESQSCAMATSELSGKMCTENRMWVLDDSEGSGNQGFSDDCDPEVKHSSQGQSKASDLYQNEGVDPFGCSGQAADIEVEPSCGNPDVQAPAVMLTCKHRFLLTLRVLGPVWEG